MDDHFSSCLTWGTAYDRDAVRIEQVRSDDTVMQIWGRGVDILCSRFVGFIRPAVVEPWFARANAIIESSGRVITFHDWTAVRGYETAVRESLVDWTREIGKKNPAAHLLFRSRIVAMGVAVGSMVLRNLHAYANVEPFLAALEEAAD